jgi:hypothetical protein
MDWRPDRVADNLYYSKYQLHQVMNGKGYWMKISISGTGVHLEGDWTLAGVTQCAIDFIVPQIRYEKDQFR